MTRITGKFSSAMNTKTDFNLNNIIATLSVSFFGKTMSRANAIRVSAVVIFKPC